MGRRQRPDRLASTWALASPARQSIHLHLLIGQPTITVGCIGADRAARDSEIKQAAVCQEPGEKLGHHVWGVGIRG